MRKVQLLTTLLLLSLTTVTPSLALADINAGACAFSFGAYSSGGSVTKDVNYGGLTSCTHLMTSLTGEIQLYNLLPAALLASRTDTCASCPQVKPEGTYGPLIIGTLTQLIYHAWSVTPSGFVWASVPEECSGSGTTTLYCKFSKNYVVGVDSSNQEELSTPAGMAGYALADEAQPYFSQVLSTIEWAVECVIAKVTGDPCNISEL